MRGCLCRDNITVGRVETSYWEIWHVVNEFMVMYRFCFEYCDFNESSLSTLVLVLEIMLSDHKMRVWKHTGDVASVPFLLHLGFCGWLDCVEFV